MVEEERTQNQQPAKPEERRTLEASGNEHAQASSPGTNAGGNGETASGQTGAGGNQAPPTDPLAEAQQALAAAQEKTLRLQAEFDNYRKRSHKEQQEWMKYAQLPLLRDLTGVMDNLERAIGHARESQQSEVQALAQGLDLVVKQLGDVFERFGMMRIAAKDQPFDPRKHEAMKVVETDSVPDNVVTEELQTGYTLHERTVRPSMVAVSRKPQSGGGEAAGESSAAKA
jgi:molecular chaperone GrpE